jgi:hypothetical protein
MEKSCIAERFFLVVGEPGQLYWNVTIRFSSPIPKGKAMLLRSVLLLISLALLVVPSAWTQEKAKFADDQADLVARGVLKVVPPEPLEEELSSGPLELYEIRKGIAGLEYTPNFEAKSDTVFEKAREVVLRRPVWHLEFSFKTMRLIEVPTPVAGGKVEPKKVWYLLYRVRNLGGHWTPLDKSAEEKRSTLSLVPEEVREGRSTLDDVVKSSANPRERSELEKFATNDIATDDRLFNSDLPTGKGIHFYPHFVLEAHEFGKEYLDRIVPYALPAIEKRERLGKPIYDSVTIAKQTIEVTTPEKDNSVWGVATWEYIDPRIDFFSIYVQGLTNAFKIHDEPAKFNPGDPPAKARSFSRKTLQIHFWRPGDTINEDSKEFKFGMPKEQDPALQLEIRKKYGFQDPLDYRWLYR